MTQTIPTEVAHELPRLRMTYQQFLDWSSDSTHAEWVDGEVVVFMPPLEIHQRLVGFLFSLLERFVALYDLGIVIGAPFEMRLPDGSSREPDLLFLAKEHFHRRTPERLNGPADLVMEVLSDSTARYDRDQKFKSFERGGIREYWLIDPRPRRILIEAYRLEPDGRYQRITAAPDGWIWSSVIPGFGINPDWLLQSPLPDPNALMLELAPDAFRSYLQKLLNRSST